MDSHTDDDEAPSELVGGAGGPGGRGLHLSDNPKEDVFKQLGRVLILSVVDGRYRAPVVTLSNEPNNIWTGLLEKQLRPEFLVGADKWWKVVKADLGVDTWRPRVHGTQLKALLNCRLPESEEELSAVQGVVAGMQHVLRSDTSPEAFVEELRRFIAGVEVWWDSRNSRRGAGTGNEIVVAGSFKRMGSMPHISKQQPPAKKPYTGPSSAGAARALGLLPDPAMASPSLGVGGGSGGLLFGSQAGRFTPAGPYADGREAGDDAGPAHMCNGGLGDLPSPRMGPNNPRALVCLSVGGKPFTTTAGTLLAARSPFFLSLLSASHAAGGGGGGFDDPPPAPRTAAGELFIDRNGQLFSHVLEYLRSLASNEPSSPLPEDVGELHALAREAEYYQLPGLLERITSTCVMPQAGARALYDSVYLETGFNSIEGPGLKEMEQRKVVVMQQMNHVLAQKALDGFHVQSADCGVNHREGPEGMQHNLYYHILLKKVMPAPTPSQMMAAAAAAAAAAGATPLQLTLPLQLQPLVPPGGAPPPGMATMSSPHGVHVHSQAVQSAVPPPGMQTGGGPPQLLPI